MMPRWESTRYFCLANKNQSNQSNTATFFFQEPRIKIRKIKLNFKQNMNIHALQESNSLSKNISSIDNVRKKRQITHCSNLISNPFVEKLRQRSITVQGYQKSNSESSNFEGIHLKQELNQLLKLDSTSDWSQNKHSKKSRCSESKSSQSLFINKALSRVYVIGTKLL